MYHIAIQRRRRTILREQRNLSRSLAAIVKRFDRLTPCRALAVVDFSQIQHMPLHRSSAANPTVFHDAPVAMLLAVLAANLVAQNHAARLPNVSAVSQATWSAPQPITANCPGPSLRFSAPYPRRREQNPSNRRASCESRVRQELRLVGANGAAVHACGRRLQNRQSDGFPRPHHRRLCPLSPVVRDGAAG